MPDNNLEDCEVFLSLTDVERCFDLLGTPATNNLTDLDRLFDIVEKSGPLLEVGGQQALQACRDPTRITVRRHGGAFGWARALIRNARTLCWLPCLIPSAKQPSPARTQRNEVREVI